MPEIILKNVRKEFGNKFVAVDNLNMVIEDRSFITLLGPSGCGKTTTLRMIAGLETPTSGQIIIDGVTVFDAEKGINVPPDKRDVGFLFQNYALWPHMTVYKNIAFGLENLKWPKDKIAERVEELLKMLKIEQFGSRYPSELSGGQQQRVAIARTLAPRPRVLFMDVQIQTVDNLIEMDFGAFEGKSADELVEKPEFKEWLKGGMDCRPPQGESVKEVQLRIFKALREIITDMMREDLLHCAMITHGGMIANMLAGFGLPKISPQELQCQPGEGFDIYVTADLWQRSQAFEILGLVPYSR